MGWSDRKQLDNDILPVLAILLAVAAVYSNTLHVPWYFDDYQNIVKNPLLRDIVANLGNIASPRGLGSLTFALNYYFHGLSLPGYHLVNIAIHIAASVTVYLLLKRVCNGSRPLALMGGLLFALHPLQTQAVTYLVQRYASLAGLFLFLSIYFFVRAREEVAANGNFLSARHLGFYLLMLFSGAAAVLTKENTIVLPLLIILYDRYFTAAKEQYWKKLSPYIAPFIVGGGIMVIRRVLLPYFYGGMSMKALTATMGVFKTADTPPLLYFVTQFTVLWKYIRLLFLPYGQTLDYAMPLVSRIFNLQNFVAGGGLLLLVLWAFWQRRRFRLASFGIFWFFISLAVESSFIPLDTIFEHRLYVPMFGFVLLLVDLAPRMSSQRWGVYGLAVFCLVTALLSYKRNSLWSNPIAFSEDNMRKAPHNPRVYMDMSKLYIEKRRLADAERMLTKGLELAPYDNRLYLNLGTLYDLMGEEDKAVEVFKKAIGLNPNIDDPYYNLGVIYIKQKRWDDAEECLQRAVKIFPFNFLSRYNLGVALYSEGKKEPARKEFLAATRLKPDDPDAWFNLAVVAKELGDVAAARDIIPRLRSINPVEADRLEKEIAGQAK